MAHHNNNDANQAQRRSHGRILPQTFQVADLSISDANKDAAASTPQIPGKKSRMTDVAANVGRSNRRTTAAPMKLLTSPNSPFARIIRIPLREKNIPYDQVMVAPLGLPGGGA